MNKNARAGVAVGFLLILATAIGIGIWAYRTDYQILFANLAPRDAATMTAELDRMKTAYKLTDGGNTIMVPKDDVYRTRLKLMGNDLALHGAVGFEVFNNADFGMTEFVQKVNYQRAIQGELTRTILSIEDIQSARVHLALPEQGLFKKSSTKPKASVTLSLKPGRVLSAEQITGIQRLVAASVPDISIADVTILNQHGVALTKLASTDGSIESASTQLDSKRMTEDYLLRKVNHVLDQALGVGEAVATVDVMLNLDQSKTTTEEILPAKGGDAENTPTGVVIRERQSTREAIAGGPSGGTDSIANNAQTGATNTVESDYQVGRRVEQVVTASGALKRITVAVVVKEPLNESQIQKIKDVVSSTVGFNSQRGDAIAVYSVDQLAASAVTGIQKDAVTVNEAANADFSSNNLQDGTNNRENDRVKVWILLVILGCVAALLGFYFISRRIRRVSRLSEREREKMLADVHAWIQSGSGLVDVDGMGHAK